MTLVKPIKTAVDRNSQKAEEVSLLLSRCISTALDLLNGFTAMPDAAASQFVTDFVRQIDVVTDDLERVRRSTDALLVILQNTAGPRRPN